ncbi:hypothetical protein F4825DRAFT_405630 [Nemania diffusa]|nr:hypothetical protein F4825DRAFT_405630 [Nemania diffusa]
MEDRAMYCIGAKELDKFVWDNPDMVVCFAAGNDAEYEESSSSGSSQWRILEGQIGYEGLAKNCITIGASESKRALPPHRKTRCSRLRRNLLA